MAILRRTDCFILIWTCIAVLAVSRHCHFQNCPGSKMKPTKNKSVVLVCCHEHVLETMSVELHGRSHLAHNAARMVRYPEHRPCGCQGMKRYSVPQGGMVSQGPVSKAVLILQVLGPQGSRDAGSMMRFQGFRRSPFIDLGFQRHQRAIRLRV